MGPETFLKDIKFCEDIFQKKKIYKDQNTNETYLQGQIKYLSRKFDLWYLLKKMFDK